ncbi:MAG: Rpn family recombination-promoting nuclease/putative transposase [Oscillospiraceae bacterium]|nr:Rpn family recombination-promoting nuclease/putative transposase [Oscillospiraceae bacterium]
MRRLCLIKLSTALNEGGEYTDLPRTIVISILAFEEFECEEFYSEYQALEVTRNTLLTDRFCLKYYELPKLPEVTDATDELKLWLSLFSAKTEELRLETN